MMTFAKIENGKYSFKGTDSWTGKQIKGMIVDQPYDKPVSHRWEVRFDNSDHAEEMFPTLKSAKNWLAS